MTITIKHLYDEKCNTEDNIIDGLINAANHKHSRRDVKWAFKHVNFVINKNIKQLEDDDFRFNINEPKFISNRVLKKNRLIVRPDFVSAQVFQHLLMNCTKEDMYKQIYKYSCGSLPERGAIYGLKYLKRRIKEECKKKITLYALKFDIQKFFESVPIDLLEAKLARRYKDPKLLLQFHKVLQANIIYWEGEYSKVGLPIGYYTSQWLANWYLSEVDNFIKHTLRIKTYVRYMDDMVIISDNKYELQTQLRQIIDFIHSIGLEIKQNYQVFEFAKYENNKFKTTRAIDFLGFKFCHNKILLRKGILKSARRKALHIYNKEKVSYHDAMAMLSYLGYFKHSDTKYFYDRNIKPYISVEALKKIISKHQKKLNERLGKKFELPSFIEKAPAPHINARGKMSLDDIL